MDKEISWKAQNDVDFIKKEKQMKRHPIKQYLDDLATWDIIRIIPETIIFEVKKDQVESAIHTLNILLRSIKNSGIDVYERIGFQVQPHDEDDEYVKIRGRYGFSQITSAGKEGRTIKIDKGFHEIPYGGVCADLNGRYTLIELKYIVEQLEEEKNT